MSAPPDAPQLAPFKARSELKLAPSNSRQSMHGGSDDTCIYIKHEPHHETSESNLTVSGHHQHHDPVSISSIDTPQDIYHHVTDTGAAKAAMCLNKSLSLGLLAGVYIGLGFSLCMLAGGQMTGIRKSDPGLFNLLYGSFGFPMGLTLVVVAGADLFTSNCMYMVAAYAEGRCTLLQGLRVWGLSYFSNLCGALFLVQMMKSGEVFEGRSEFTINLALAKTSHPFGVEFVRGFFCNVLVCLAVWQANAARDLWGKFIGIWLPISGFVAMGFEHCIANMFLVPLSMKLGSGITAATFITKNLIPVTLGNIVGGGFFVGGIYAISYGSWDVEAALKKLAKALAAHFTAKRRLTDESEQHHAFSPRQFKILGLHSATGTAHV